MWSNFRLTNLFSDGPIRREEADSVTLQTTISSAPSVNQQNAQNGEELPIPEPSEPAAIINLEPVQANATTSEPAPAIQHPSIERKSSRTVKPVKRYGFDD